MKCSDIEFKKSDHDGEEVEVLQRDFQAENSKGGLHNREFTTCGMIKDKDQVVALQRLISHLHSLQDRLFQRVLAGVRPKTGPWFANAPMGHNSLADMMPLLSVRAKLSTRYTNH